MPTLKKLSPQDLSQFRSLRQKHLEMYPMSVSTSASAWKNASDTQILALLEYSDQQKDNCILGALEDQELVGMIGFKRETQKATVMHKAVL